MESCTPDCAYFGVRNTKGKTSSDVNKLCLKGGMSGIFGSTVGCPLYMIKTQLQAQSHGSFAVGFQHGHKGTIDALKRVLRENGIRGA